MNLTRLNLETVCVFLSLFLTIGCGDSVIKDIERSEKIRSKHEVIYDK